jgi:hypothetical protein
VATSRRADARKRPAAFSPGAMEGTDEAAWSPVRRTTMVYAVAAGGRRKWRRVITTGGGVLRGGTDARAHVFEEMQG